MQSIGRGVLSVLLWTTVLGAGVARADDPKDFGNWFLVKSKDHGDFCMDASQDEGKRGREVYIYKCHGKFNQRWTITHPE